MATAHVAKSSGRAKIPKDCLCWADALGGGHYSCSHIIIDLLPSDILCREAVHDCEQHYDRTLRGLLALKLRRNALHIPVEKTSPDRHQLSRFSAGDGNFEHGSGYRDVDTSSLRY